MPVGMTLQQLYSQPTYHAEASSGVSAATSVSISTSSAIATSSAGVANSKRPPSIQTSALPEKDYSPRPHDGAYTPQDRSYQDHHAAMQQQQHYAPYGQLPPPHAYSQYHPKQPTHGGDDYGIADPLPFEYMGMRKFPDNQAKDQVSDHRYAMPGAQYPGQYSAHSPHPSVYESQHAHPPKSVEDRAYHASYAHHASDRAYHNAPAPAGGPVDGPGHFPHAPHSSMPSHLYAASAPMSNMHSMPAHHSFPPLLDTHSKKETIPSPTEYASTVEYPTGPATGPGGASQEAVIKVKTPLKTKYWRNGRRNLQCFPSCKVFGDYSSIKIEDLKQHDFMWGKCRGSLITEVSLNSSVSFDDILLLGRVHSLENVPVVFEEAVIRECMLGRMVEPEVMDGMKDQWITGERLPDFVQQDGNTACYEFKPKVWKYTEDMTQGKCKRRNVKYYVQFEAFVLVMSGERRYYACIGSGMSTAFEVGSSRVLARQKRKAATGLDANPLYTKQSPSMGSPTDIGSGMPHQMGVPMHGMMPGPHNMHSQMYPGNFQQQQQQGYPPARGLAPAMPHPSMMGQMLHPEMGGSLHYHQGPPQQQQQTQQQQQPPQAPAPAAPSAGQKRKATSSAPRATKAKKTKEMAPV